MNYFLAFIILFISGACIYVHNADIHQDAANQQIISDLGNQIKQFHGANEKLAEDNEKLQNDKAKLAKNLKDLEEDNVKMGDTTSALNKRLDEARAEVTRACFQNQKG